MASRPGQTCIGKLLCHLSAHCRYVDGKHVATLDPKTKRTAEALTAFINKQTGTEPSTDTDPNPNRLKANNPPPANPNGMVLSMNAENFTQHISLTPSKSSNEGWFVKFYAPWCSHCKHMAAAWTELGREMKGKLNIGQVNCELESKLCKDVKLRGYPTLVFFKGGERVEYDGLRGLGDLVSFSNKAVQYVKFPNSLT
jgi:protein disulfide-isomerase